MRHSILSFTSERGWSAPFPAVDDPARTLVIAFGASQLRQRPRPITDVIDQYPGAVVVGCSTAGEIDASTIRDDSLVVAVASFDKTTLTRACAPVQSAADSFAAGQAIGERLRRPDLRAVFVVSDGLKVNGSELVRGLNAVVPPSVVITGGLAGDGDRFQETWVIHDGRLASGLVTAVGLSGDSLLVGHGSRGGWDIFGPERLVTRSSGNVLYELDGNPALGLYKSYLGDRASGLQATGLLFPLALRASHTDERHLVRTILGVDEATQSLTFAGDIPEGWLAQLMSANFDRLIEGASTAAQSIRRPGSLAIAISCVGRRLVLGERAEEEVEATQEMYPEGTGQIGFYSYGEISPFATGACDLHNQTMTITSFAEA